MRIAMVTHAFPRWDGDMAGAFIARLGEALVARDNRVWVVTPADEGQGGREVCAGMDVLRVRYSRPERETLAHRGTLVAAVRGPSGLLAAGAMVVKVARAVRRLVREERVDVVHAHWWIPSGVSVWLRGVPNAVPYVVTLHGTDVTLLNNAGLRWLAKRVLRGASGVTAVSSYLAERAAELCGVRTSAVQPMPAAVGRFTAASKGGGGVVTVGRLIPQKRIADVIDAVAKLRDRLGKPALTVIGDGPLHNSLERRAQDHGIDVRFTGRVEPEELPALIADADVFALPAIGEGFGLAAAEALMAGVPVVVTRDGGGLLDIVSDGPAGRVVAGGDVDALAAALHEVATDPNARAAAVVEGNRWKERLSAATVAESFERIYSNLDEGHA